MNDMSNSGALEMPKRLPAGLDLRFLGLKAQAHRDGKSDERAFLWNAYLLGEGALKTEAGA